MMSKQEALDGEPGAGEPPRQAEIHLIVFGMVETRIERADLAIAMGPHQHGLLLHEILLQHARKDLVVGDVRHRHAAAALDPAAGIAVDDPAPRVDEVHGRTILEDGTVTFEVLRQRDVVVVEDPHRGSPHPGHRTIECARLADILLVDHFDAVAVAPQHVRRAVGRPVVHHDDLGRRQGLAKNAVQGLTEKVSPVVGGDDRRDVGRPGSRHGGQFRTPAIRRARASARPARTGVLPGAGLSRA